MRIVFDSINLVSLLFTVVITVTTALVVMAQARKISHEQLAAIANDWQEVAEARMARITMLHEQQKSFQTQILDLSTKIVAFEKDQNYLERRNRELGQTVEQSQSRIEKLEDLLREHNIRVPNGG